MNQEEENIKSLATLIPHGPENDFLFEGQIVINLAEWLVEKGLFASQADIKRWEKESPKVRPEVVVFTKKGESTFDFMFIETIRGKQFAFWPGEVIMVGRNAFRQACI